MPERKPRQRSSIAVGADMRGFERRPSRVRKLMRIAMRRPADSAAVLSLAVLAGAIVVNALYFQPGPHPSPLVAAGAHAGARETTGSLTAAPRPRPLQAVDKEGAEVRRARLQLISDIQRELARKGFYDGPIDGLFGPKMDVAIREFEQAAGMRVSGEPTEALLQALMRSAVKSDRAKAAAPAVSRKAEAPAVPPSRRVAAVQRALADFGYGQLKLTGVLDEPTKSAIEKFERERKLPVKGQISDRLLRELAAVTGRPLE